MPSKQYYQGPLDLVASKQCKQTNFKQYKIAALLQAGYIKEGASVVHTCRAADPKEQPLTISLVVKLVCGCKRYVEDHTAIFAAIIS